MRLPETRASMRTENEKKVTLGGSGGDRGASLVDELTGLHQIVVAPTGEGYRANNGQ
jgi:hypothetical protein